MKSSTTVISLLLALPAALKALDTLPRASIFDEGYFFIGPGDVLKFSMLIEIEIRKLTITSTA